MVQVIPKDMGAIRTSMDKAVSRFALKAQEDDALPATKLYKKYLQRVSLVILVTRLTKITKKV